MACLAPQSGLIIFLQFIETVYISNGCMKLIHHIGVNCAECDGQQNTLDVLVAFH